MSDRRAATMGAVALTIFLGLAAPSGVCAQGAGAPPVPDAGWHERDYLLHYATVVCVRGAYGTLAPSPVGVIEALDQEAWAMVEFTRQAPETYEHIHRLATAYGAAEAPQRALAACGAWVKRETVAILKTSTERR